MSERKTVDTPIGLDHTRKLPKEILVKIFSQLDSLSLVKASSVCKCWKELIENCQIIWKLQCLTLKDSTRHIKRDRKKGHSWKETFKRNFGRNGIKRKWKEGRFSNPQSYNELPERSFCRLDKDSWGEILQWELERS